MEPHQFAFLENLGKQNMLIIGWQTYRPIEIFFFSWPSHETLAQRKIYDEDIIWSLSM